MLLSIVHIRYGGWEACPKFDMLLIGGQVPPATQNEKGGVGWVEGGGSVESKGLSKPQLLNKKRSYVSRCLSGSSLTCLIDCLYFSKPFLPFDFCGEKKKERKKGRKGKKSWLEAEAQKSVLELFQTGILLLTNAAFDSGRNR